MQSCAIIQSTAAVAHWLAALLGPDQTLTVAHSSSVTRVPYSRVLSKSCEIRSDFGRCRYGMKTVVVVIEKFTHRSATSSLSPASEIMLL